MAAGFDSLRVRLRWCGISLRVTWFLVVLAAGWGFDKNIRTGFMVLLVGFSLVTVQMMVRDNISRRMEQRRKPYRVKGDTEAEQTAAVGAGREE